VARVLVVSFWFPPDNSIGGLRVGKMAKFLYKAGHDVRVLTARGQGSVLADLPVELPPDRVTAVPWTQASRTSASKTAARVRGRWGEGLPARIARTFLHRPDPFVGWRRPALAAAEGVANGWSPDVILASAGPVTSLLVARTLSARLKVPWVADMRDLWSDNQNYPYLEVRRVFERQLERRILGDASAMVTVSFPLAQTLRRRYSMPVEIVLNGFDPDDYPAQRDAPPDGPLHLVYTGTIYPAHQSVDPLMVALARHEGTRQIRFTYYGPQDDLVRRAADQAGVSHLVKTQGVVPHREAVAAQCGADVLVHLLWQDRTQPGVYNAKIFEYLGARRPILAIGPAENVTADLVRDLAVGVVCETGDSIVAALNTWVAQKEVGHVPAPVASDVALYTREAQAARLEAVITQVLVS